MAKPSEYDKTHLRNMAAIGTRIDRIFKKAAEEAAKIGVSIKSPLTEDKIFSFDDYPETQKQIERLMKALQDSTETTIVNGVRSAWTLSNNKNNDLVSRIFGDKAKDLSKEEYKRYFSTNMDALNAFLSRKEQGLNLSDRVWRYTNAFKKEIELGLDLGIRQGESAAQMTRSLRQYLQHPDKLFRRVRDEHGNLKLSKAAAAFHPGRGVYRSSYKNARRLACTETNIAYRTSDYLRWQQMDFVVGIEIKLSNNHTLNGVPLTDICDTLAGKYPKDFKFTGWHPHCRCHAITILKTEEEMQEDTTRILAGEKPKKGSVNAIGDVPDAFKAWIEQHAQRIEMGGNLPYFVKDNDNLVGRILGLSDNPEFAIKIDIGGKVWTLKQMIAECRIEPTKNGKIYVHPEHGKRELPENIRIARWRAEQFGEEIILIPNPQNIPTPDSYNITRGIKEEYKHSKTPTLNAIDRRLRDASHQAEYVIFEIDSDINSGVVTDALKSRMRRCSIKEVRIKIGEAEAIYTREQILNQDFKIKPEDFHNVSDFRSRGSSQKRGEPNIDANLAHFFGLDKKSLKQIAEERHAARTPEQIQAIKDAWAAKKQRDANTKLLANNVLKLKSEYPFDIDFSDLEKYIQQGELKRMRAEAKKVGQTILAVKKEEQMLSDLLPDVHKWHKQFSIAELKEAHAKVKSTLDYWKNKGYDLATNSNLSILKTQIEQKIKFVENPGAFKAGLIAHKTWQVQQKAYKELLGKVEVQIELNTLQAEYQALLGFSTTSKDFKNYMAKAKAALDVSDSKDAKFYINLAKSKKHKLEKRASKKKVGITKSTQFGNDAYSQARKNAAMWAQDTKDADLRLRDRCGDVWRSASDEERDAIYGYTRSYCNINEPLRGLTYYGSAAQAREGLARIPHIESIIDRSTYDFDMWLQRGDGLVALKKFGLTNWSNPTDADIMGLLGAEGVEGAFWSAGVAKGKGFVHKRVIFNIYAPKGTKAMYCEPFSAYGNGSGRGWDGKSRQSSFGNESEILIQRGTKFKITKIEQKGGKWYIDVDIIEQKPVKFPYVGGYPFK